MTPLHAGFLAAATLLLHGRAWAQGTSVPASPSPAVVAAQEADKDLGCFFDGNCRSSALPRGPALRPEGSPLPPAPRYTLDLQEVPKGVRRLIPGYELLPHKNQEETREWVDHINLLVRAKNARRTSSRMAEWAYDGRTNEPPFACLSYGISTVMDWWTLQCGGELPSYRSSVHGRPERGWDPRVMELEYFYRASHGDERYPLFSEQLPIERDPVRRIPVPYSPLGYAEIALERSAYENPDPYSDEVRGFDPARGPMDGRFVQLFTNRVFRSRTPDAFAKVLAEAIEKWGIAYVQLEQTQRPRMFGAHSVGVIGYFCLESDGRFFDCGANASDEDWGRTAYFVVHDSFGDFPAERARDAQGGSAYRAVRIESIDEAYVFPHGLTVAADPAPGRPGRWNLRVTNRCGRPVRVESVRPLSRPGSAGVSLEQAPGGGFELAGGAGQKARLEVAVRHYFEADGRPRVFALTLDPRGPARAAEEIRTPEQPGFYGRREGR